MTTIACDGFSMAADGILTAGNCVIARCAVKIERLPDGRIVGWAGNQCDGVAFLEWMRTGGEIPKLDYDSFGALILNKDGSIFKMEHNCLALPMETPIAIGSGCVAALATLHLGFDSRRAVEIASLIDKNTGGQITVIARDVA